MVDEKGDGKMIYRDLCGEKVSMYGMGCMRLPKTDATDDASVDVEETEKMVEYAFEHGVNYFDTAWGYNGGKSEIVMGNALSKHPRDSYYLTSKFPGYDSRNWGRQTEIFPEQLKKCKTDYFDFYLVHNVCEMNIDAYVNEEKYGLKAFLCEQRDAGKIHHLGFSVHGSLEVMQRFLDTWADSIEFVQIQLNFVDYAFQEAKEKLELAKKYDLPVIVMEPMRGGMLAKASAEEIALLERLRPSTSVAGWALRYAQSFDQVKCILSGASSLEQMSENLHYFEDEKPLSAEEFDALYQVADNMLKDKLQPCTECCYCLLHCPKQINIPYILKLYNEHCFTGGGFLAPMAVLAIEEGRRPSDCTECGACSAVCTQQIDIPAAMVDFAKRLEKKD